MNVRGNIFGIRPLEKGAAARVSRFMCAIVLLLGTAMEAPAQTVTAIVAVGGSPIAVAANPATNKIYVVIAGSSVTVIDGATNTTATVAVGASPIAVAVNSVTNKIYVANHDGSSVTVIDGATNTTTTVAAGTNPAEVAVNPVTNKIYVANEGSANVTVIDGATNTTATVAVGGFPFAVALNPLTDKIYVANAGGQVSSNVTVIDGATNTTTTVATAGVGLDAVAVNPVTNKIYVTSASAPPSVIVIDGATNTTTTVAATGASPQSVAVNPVTNKIYVGNLGGVMVIDGATNATTTVAAGSGPIAVAVNQITNKIFVPNLSSANVTVIDGATNTSTTVAAGTAPRAVAVDPVTNKIYVANEGSANVTVIDGTTGCGVTTAPTGQSFGAEGGLGSFIVSTGVNCNWSATANDSWITIWPSASGNVCIRGGGCGTRSPQVNFDVASNSNEATGTHRTGSISVGGQLFTIDQLAVSCSYSISPTVGAFGNTGGTSRVVVTAPAGCPSWSAFTSAGWMTLSLTTGTGRGQVVVNAAANTGAARSGTVTIAGQTFSATQSATQGADACGALDVTSQVGVTQGQFNFFSLEFGTAIFYQNVTVMNTSSGVVPGPVYLALIGLPTHHHSLFGPESFLLVLPPGTAATTCFTPVDDYPIPGDYLIPISGGLQPGQSVPLLLTFGQGGWPLSYSAKVLSGAPSH